MYDLRSAFGNKDTFQDQHSKQGIQRVEITFYILNYSGSDFLKCLSPPTRAVIIIPKFDRLRVIQISNYILAHLHLDQYDEI